MKAALSQLKVLLASPDADRVDRAAALGPEVLDALLADLPAPSGLGFAPPWRVKRERWVHVHQTLGAVVLRHLDALTHRDHLHLLVPPAHWDRLGTDRVSVVQGVPLVRVPAAAGPATVSRDLLVSATPVTFRMWKEVVGHDIPDDTAPDAPVFVEHAGAIAFCNALSKRAGLAPAYVDRQLTDLGAEGFRLLTEAEWEHAARAGTSTDTFAGDVKVRHGHNPALEPAIRYGEPSSRTPPVATRIPNAFGLYDLLGLAWERVQDAYPSTPPLGIDPCATDDHLPEGKRGRHVKKGGSYHNFACLCTVETRMDDERKSHTFRVARPVSGPRPEVLADAPAPPLSAWSDVVWSTEGGRPRALCVDGDDAWLAVDDRVLILDASLGQAFVELGVPKGIRGLAIDADALWVSVAGQLVAYPERGRGAPVRVPPFDDVFALSVHDGVLVGGGFRQGIVVPGEIILSGPWGKDPLHSVAMDATRIYAGFYDDRVFVYDRASGKRLRSLAGRSVAVTADGTVWTADRRGTLTAHDPVSLAPRVKLPHPGGSPWRWVDLTPWGSRVVSRGAGLVQVVDASGDVVGSWTCPVPTSDIVGVTPHGDALYVLIADRHPSGRVLRLSLG